MVKTEYLEISPEGIAFRQHITELLTKTVLSEGEHPKMRAYVDSGIENGKFIGKGTRGVLEKLGIVNCGCRFRVSEHEGRKVFEFAPAQEYGPIIMYIHGGAYVFGYTDIYFRFNETLAVQCNAKVVAPIYGLAEGGRKGVCGEAYEMLVSEYLALLEEGRPVYLMGDSSGGAMAVRLSQILIERNMPAPAGLVLFSPFADATLKDTIPEELVWKDITLDRFGLIKFAKMWAGEKDLSDPDVSPLHGPMEGLPKTMIVVGTDEIFLPSNESLAEKIESAGVNVSMVECRGSYHIFPVYTQLPESQEVMRRIVEFVN